MKRNGKEAWVLAEWLTALFLLGVIMAVALPDFYLARTRSDASQVVLDLRSLETALTAYKLDSGRWIDDASFWSVYAKPKIQCNGMNDLFIWGHLTTPITYIATLPVDPFQVTMDSRLSPFRGYWYYGKTGWIRAIKDINIDPDEIMGDWIMASPGPDLSWGYGEWNIVKEQRDLGYPRMYDPSNGILSYGDIVLWENMEQTLVAPVE